ncbi:MAG: helix-turn-helix transcriptional regulator [Halobacteriaceae archaeon]
MSDSLEDVAFLTRSAHRVTVLRELADGPRTRTDLVDATGASRVTVGRILGDFTDRNWAVRDGDTYRVTPLGRLLAEDLSRLLDSAAVGRRFRDVLGLLPTDAIDVDFRAFADATVTEADPADPTAPARRYASVMADADAVRVLSRTAKPAAIRHHREAVSESEQSFAVVHAERSLSAIATDPEMRAWLRDIAASGQGEHFRTDRAVPVDLMIADETVVLMLSDEDGTRPAVVESDDETVRAWAVEMFEAHRADATPVAVEDLPD